MKIKNLIKGAIILLCFIAKTSFAQIAVHTDNTYANVAMQTAKKVGYLELYRKWTENIHDSKDRTMKDYAVIDMVQQRIYNSLNDVDMAMRQAKSAYYAGQKIVKMTENLAKAGQLAANKPYLLVYWRKMTPVMIGRANELKIYMTEFIQKNKKDVLMNKTARDMFLWKTYQDIDNLYNLSEVMLKDFQRVKLAEAVNSVIPYQYYISQDKAIVNSTLFRLKGLL